MVNRLIIPKETSIPHFLFNANKMIEMNSIIKPVKAKT